MWRDSSVIPGVQQVVGSGEYLTSVSSQLGSPSLVLPDKAVCNISSYDRFKVQNNNVSEVNFLFIHYYCFLGKI